jgi:site-specific recombinase XerD
MDNFEKNLPKLIKYMMSKGLKINSMSKDIAAFRRYFQLRIQEEEEKEKSAQDKFSLNINGDN